MWIELDTDCVAPYSVKTLLQRGASSCPCEGVQYDCGGTTQFFQDNACSSNQKAEEVPHPQACYPFVNAAFSVKLNVSSPSALVTVRLAL